MNSDWIRPSLEATTQIWGFRSGIQVGICPADIEGKGDGGPRGRFRVGYPILDGGKSQGLVNFVAVEPVVKSQRGFSELEHSDLSNNQGKLFWTGSRDSTPPTSTQAQAPRKRGGCCAFGLFALLFAAATTSWLYSMSSTSRYRVFGNTDQATGYRLEYSVSSRYIQHVIPYPNVLGCAQYIPKPQSIFSAWINANITHRSQSTFPVYGQSNRFIVLSRHLDLKTMTSEDSMMSPAYYLNLATSGGPKRIESGHIVVSKSSAIWLVTEWVDQGSGTHRFRSYTLIVHPLHKPVSYSFDGFAEGTDDQARLRNEMMAIRDSIVIKGL